MDSCRSGTEWIEMGNEMKLGFCTGAEYRQSPPPD